MTTPHHETAVAFPHNREHDKACLSGVDTPTARKTDMRRHIMPALARHRSQASILHIVKTSTQHMDLTQIIHQYIGSIAFALTISVMAKVRQQTKDLNTEAVTNPNAE